MRTRVAALLWLLAIAAGVRPAMAAEVRVPVDLVDGLPLAPVSVDGHAARWFLVDTGTAVTTLSDRLAAELRLVSEGPHESESASGVIRGHRGAITSLRVGTAELGGGRVVWHALDRVSASRRRRIDGILGFDRLSATRVLFDYRARELRLGIARVPDARRAARVPFVLANGRPAVDVLVQVGHAPARVRRLVVDSGASVPVLVESVLSFAVTPAVRLLTLAGTATAYAADVSLTLAGMALGPSPAVLVERPREATREDDGLLPAAAFAWVCFDPARSEIVLGR